MSAGAVVQHRLEVLDGEVEESLLGGEYEGVAGEVLQFVLFKARLHTEREERFVWVNLFGRRFDQTRRRIPNRLPRAGRGVSAVWRQAQRTCVGRLHVVQSIDQLYQ